MKNTGIVEVAFGNHEGKEGLWLKLNEPIPFEWEKVGNKYFLNLSARTEKKYNFEEAREKHPNAYKPWSSEDDDLLERLYADGTKMKELCSQLGRNRGAITSRIDKLGLKDIY